MSKKGFSIVKSSKESFIKEVVFGLYEEDNTHNNRGQLTPDVFYGYLIACGYVLI